MSEYCENRIKKTHDVRGHFNVIFLKGISVISSL